MPRRQFNDGQEIIYPDLSSISPSLEMELYDRIIYELMERQQGVVFSDSFLPLYVNATTVSLKLGNGVQYDSAQVDPEPKTRLLNMIATTNAVISTPHATLNRIDLICIRANRATASTQSRNVKDAISGVVAATSLVVETDWSTDILVVPGVASGSPVAPATPTGYLPVAQCAVTAVSGIANQAAIVDVRPRFKDPFAWETSNIVTGSYAIDFEDALIVCKPTAPMNLTLPNPAAYAGKKWTIINNSAFVVTVVGTVSGQVNPTIDVQYSSLNIKSDGVEFYLT